MKILVQNAAAFVFSEWRKNGIFYVYLQLCVNNKKGDNDMTTLELDKVRVELAREILNTDNAEMLDTVKRAICSFTGRNQAKAVSTEWPSIGPMCMDEVDARIDESETDEAAGRMYTTEEVRQNLEQQFPWLCK